MFSTAILNVAKAKWSVTHLSVTKVARFVYLFFPFHSIEISYIDEFRYLTDGYVSHFVWGESTKYFYMMASFLF